MRALIPTDQIHTAAASRWMVLYIVVVVHTFVGIAILADDFFVPSLEAISQVRHQASFVWRVIV